jgi:hypothetical protein
MRIDGVLFGMLIPAADACYQALIRDENPMIRELYLDVTEKLALHIKYKGQDDAVAVFLNQALLKVVARDESNELVLLRTLNCICDVALFYKSMSTKYNTCADRCGYSARN